MIIKTKHFSEIEVKEENILKFEEGIFGFENSKKFVIIYDNETENSPFCWLQSTEEEEVCLPMIDPVTYFPDYNPEISGELVGKIGELKVEDINLFTVVVVPDDIKKMTTNLKAPILVNIQTKKGIQVVVEDEEYLIKHNLYDQIKSLKEAGE